jgi:F-type H+-transporting ATPase subunit c
MQILIDALHLTTTILAQTTPAEPVDLNKGLSAVEVGIAAGGAAIGIGAVGAGASQAVGRNPGAMGIILGASLIFVGIAEGTFILVAFVLKG